MKSQPDEFASPGTEPPVSIPIYLPQLASMNNKLDAVLDGTGQRLYTLEQAHGRKYGKTKGGISYSTIKNCPAMQPRGGKPDGWCSGKKVWSVPTVEEWCLVDDLHLGEYLAKYNPNIKVPARIIEANKRHSSEQVKYSEAFDEKEY